MTVFGDAVELPEVTAPGTPAAGKVFVYAKSDGKIYTKDDSGVERLTTGGHLQVTQVEYNAITTPDPNILYVIIG